MPSIKKSYDISNIDSQTKEYIANVDEKFKKNSSGIAGDAQYEANPEFIKNNSEKVLNNGGSYIVLGRDRPGSRLSGYGGKGNTQCNSIDIVVGRRGYEARSVNENNEKIYVDNDFKKDAARIYISQKTDIDENFDIKTPLPSKTRSSIALKADTIRFISRENIKIIAGDKSGNNSQGGEIKTNGSIELVANNDFENLEPIPKGDSLKSFLSEVINSIDGLSGIVANLIMAMSSYNEILGSHFHISPFFAIPTTPSTELISATQKLQLELLMKVQRQILNLKTNLGTVKINYLNALGKNYINSRNNKTN